MKTIDLERASSFTPRPAEGLNYPNVMQMFLARVRKTPELSALRFRQRGAWRPLSWRDWEVAAREIAAGLIDRAGVEPGDRVALMARTCVEWALCDLAIALCGAVSVPIYSTSTGAEMAFVLGDSGAVALLAQTPQMLERLVAHEREAGAGSLAALRWTICFEPEAGAGRSGVHAGDGDRGRETTSLAALRERGAATFEGVNDVQPQIEAAIAGVGLLDPFTIVYTSGTTGRPKGAILTHKNLVYEAWAIKNSIAVDRSDEQLLMLPLAHIFARHLLWAAVESGATTAFSPGLDAAVADMAEVAPTYVGAVPRFYEKIQQGIEDQVAGRSFVERKLFDAALEVGRKVSVLRQRGQAIPPLLAGQYRIADKGVFERIRARFGGRLRFFISGAAPLSRKTAEFFHAAGVLILEGYGLTETTGATHVNRPDRFRFGTVGPALPGCEILIAGDGEILLRGHNVMAGYHGSASGGGDDETVERGEGSEADAEPLGTRIDDDGWLHTGDIGRMQDGFLVITDRLKDLIITAGGKNIAPQKLEARLRRRRGIAHALVTGDRRPYLVALIGLDEDEMLTLAKRERLGCRTYADLARHPRVREIVRTYVDELNASLPSYETIKDFAIPAQPFAPDQLTPTLKLKRRAVESRCAEQIELLYTRSARKPPP